MDMMPEPYSRCKFMGSLFARQPQAESLQEKVMRLRKLESIHDLDHTRTAHCKKPVLSQTDHHESSTNRECQHDVNFVG